MAILVSIALGVLLDILIDVMISRPRHECSIRRRGLGPLPRHFVGGNWHGHKESVGFQSRAGELSHVWLSDAASATTEVLEAIALRWLDLREVWKCGCEMDKWGRLITRTRAFPYLFRHDLPNIV